MYYRWEQEWGSHLKVLLAARKKGQDPAPLRNRPKLNRYYKELIAHFQILSFSRQRTVDGQPNPIDIQAILSYNEKVYKLPDYGFFLFIMQSLDREFLTGGKKPASEG